MARGVRRFARSSATTFRIVAKPCVLRDGRHLPRHTAPASLPAMLARLTTFAVDGLVSRRVTVEVDLRLGLPAFTIVGLADAAVRESRERVHAAVLNSGFEFPGRRITVNLAPAHLRKVGPGFDLATACGVLVASGQVPGDALDAWAVFGELSLGGELRPCRGVLAVAEGAREAGIAGLVVPRACAAEAALVDGLRVAPADDLAGVVAILRGDVPPAAAPPAAPSPGALPPEHDLRDVRGHAEPLLALTVAAAGGHNLLLSGPPGTGKTMLARRLPTVLPPLSASEALEVTRVQSVAGVRPGAGLVRERPFRAPHHTISAPGLVGGGAVPTPGEASLAHHGVLFLDELSEFPRASLEALRQPLEDGRVVVVRGQRSSVFPTRFMLVAATNPCPCGHGAPPRCHCTEAELARHRRRLSGPLLDRIDLLVAVRRPTAAELAAPPRTTSAEVRDRVLEARERQAARLRGTGIACNAHLTPRLLRDGVALGEDALALLRSAYDGGHLSARGHARVLRVARTVADLDGAARVGPDHVLQAIAFRQDAEAEEAAA